MLRNAYFTAGFTVASSNHDSRQENSRLFTLARKANRALTDAERFCGLVTKEESNPKSTSMKRCDTYLHNFYFAIIDASKHIEHITSTQKPTEDYPLE